MLVGGWVGRLLRCLVAWLLGYLVAWLLASLLGCLVARLVGRWVGRSVKTRLFLAEGNGCEIQMERGQSEWFALTIPHPVHVQEVTGTGEFRQSRGRPVNMFGQFIR